MIGKLLCFLGLHKWERDGKQTDIPGWVKVKCRRQSCKWVKLSNFLTGEIKHVNTLIFEVR